MTRQSVSRRSFLKAAAVGAGLSAFPTIIPASVLGPDAPSRKLNLAAIGLGGMGNGNLGAFLGHEGVRVVAVCDVDERHANAARDRVNKQYKDTGCAVFRDFRALLARGDLDLCSIAVPDHWHALLYTSAMKAGCDVYGEKPLARSIREGRAVADAQRRYGRVWQTGSWQRSTGNFYQACMLVRNGRIGRVARVEVGLPTGRPGNLAMPAEPPKELDWNFWLGPAPWRPFIKFSDRAPHWDWRWIMDYSGGQLTDWAGHHIDIAHWGLGLDRTGPVAIEGRGEYPADGIYDVPFKYDFTCTYAGGLQINVTDGSRNRMGTKWIGEDGRWLFVTRGGLEASSPAILKEEIGPEEIQLVRSTNHQRNFIDCARTRRETITPAEVAHRSISVGLLGEIAMLTGRKLRWNPETEQFAGDEAANALLMRPYREPWKLEV